MLDEEERRSESHKKRGQEKNERERELRGKRGSKRLGFSPFAFALVAGTLLAAVPEIEEAGKKCLRRRSFCITSG